MVGGESIGVYKSRGPGLKFNVSFTSYGTVWLILSACKMER